MANLSATSYDHRYFVDGQIEVTSRAMQGNNSNILVGALGRGGRGVFALDVTDTDSMGTGDVLWDNTHKDSPADPSSEERRVGTECVGPRRSRGRTGYYKKK